jgi:ubiquinone/menaquinone biosynthesis C-methylase UbiE
MLAKQARELRRLWSGFQQARVLMTANNLRMFEHLKKPKTAIALAKAIKADKRATELMLDALTGMGLLRKTKGRYKNTLLAERFLVKESAYYQGDILRHADSLWKRWSALDEVVRTGRPAAGHHDHEAFILGMHNIAALKVKAVLKEMNLKGVNTALDLGGGPGTYALEMAKRGISVTLFDLPETIKIAKKLLKAEKAKGIRFLAGDFLSDDIGEGYDLIFISQIFHAYSAKDNMSALRKCRKALNPQGRVVIQEFYINESRTHPPQSSLFSINMLVSTEGGRCYTTKEMKGWLSKTGFTGITEKVLEDTVLIQGVRA